MAVGLIRPSLQTFVSSQSYLFTSSGEAAGARMLFLLIPLLPLIPLILLIPLLPAARAANMNLGGVPYSISNIPGN